MNMIFRWLLVFVLYTVVGTIYEGALTLIQGIKLGGYLDKQAKIKGLDSNRFDFAHHVKTNSLSLELEISAMYAGFHGIERVVIGILTLVPVLHVARKKMVSVIKNDIDQFLL